MKKYIYSVIAMLALAGPVAAADAPIFSLSRLTLAAGFNYVFEAPGVQFGEVGLYSAYNLTPHLSLSHSSVKKLEDEFFDNSVVETRVGVRVRFGGSK